MTILTLNICQGGGKRVGAILAYLEAQPADLLCLTEFRHGSTGRQLKEGLDSLGYHHRELPAVAVGQNTVALFSRHPLASAELNVPEDLRRHLLPTRVGDLLVIGAYFPQNKAKAPVFDWLLEASTTLLAGKTLVLGDFNTGLNEIQDCEGTPFHCADQFQALTQPGRWRDAYRELNGPGEAYTWLSNRGNGFRVDHAFVSRGVGLERADYDDTTRAKVGGVTYHSSLRLIIGG